MQPSAPDLPRTGRSDARRPRGQQLGRLDPGGHCLLLTCLHLGAVRGRDDYLDPALLLGHVRLTLLPSSTPWS